MSLPTLPTRKIGKDEVTAIGYGAMGIAAFYGAVDSDEERLKVRLHPFWYHPAEANVHQFLDELYASGCTNWDTANVYGDSEVLIGKWLQKTGKRKDIFLATKFAITREPVRPVNGDPEYVKKCIEQSLSRLGVDYVDLYYMHRPDQTVPIEITMGALKELVQEGKIRYIGLSECSAATIRRAHAIHPIAALQVEYSVFTLDIEHPDVDILRTARELGIAIIAYSPLGRGLLTGRYKSPDDFEEGDFRRGMPRFSKENFPRLLNIVDALNKIGAKYNATPGQVALAWVLAQGPDFIPIPGTRKVKYLEENLGALKFTLSAEDIIEVRRLAEAADKTLGDRYPSQGMALILADTPPLESWKGAV
ncbi:hypothetical protein EIP86_006201 [Pleurotus ostreatoroseus]|nr:hypothetical protein EIP86_006201 [Pleurotus ostreatoroseus]